MGLMHSKSNPHLTYHLMIYHYHYDLDKYVYPNVLYYHANVYAMIYTFAYLKR